MADYLMAARNGRNIPTEDTIFGINRRAQEMAAREGREKVINGTIGALLDDDGKLMVLSSVDKAFHDLEPVEYAAYAPIGGTPDFKKAAERAAFGRFVPKGFVGVVATPGGTGSLRNAVANYTEPGDSILTSDWFWSPYGTIAAEQGRKVETFRFFNDNRGFDTEDFGKRTAELLAVQDRLLIILNTPAQNPTGYSLTLQDWENLRRVMNDLPETKKIALVIDTAYIDFAGDEDEYRQFFPILEELNDNILPIVCFSASKTFTLYGMRCGAMICIAKEEAVRDEFVRVCEFSSRGSWSNSARAGQSIIANIFSDEKLLNKVTEERKEIRDLLIARGRAFEEAASEAGLTILPFDSGFFATIPCEDPKALSAKLEEKGVFLVPLAKGVRVSIASISEEQARIVPAKVVEAMAEI